MKFMFACEVYEPMAWVLSWLPSNLSLVLAHQVKASLTQNITYFFNWKKILGDLEWQVASSLVGANDGVKVRTQKA